MITTPRYSHPLLAALLHRLSVNGLRASANRCLSCFSRAATMVGASSAQKSTPRQPLARSLDRALLKHRAGAVVLRRKSSDESLVP